MHPTTPRFLMGMRAWQELCGELDRVAPDEGLAVPLMSIELRRGLAHPVQTMYLDQIKHVIIPRLFLLPGHLQDNRWARVQALAGSDDALQSRIDRCLDLYPRLRPAGFIHSHPFAKARTWPSSGPRGDIEGHLKPLMQRNGQSGLATGFSLIACRNRSGRGWKLQAFALDRQGQVSDCGMVQPAPEGHPALRRALRGHAMQQQAGRKIILPWLQHMKSSGLQVQTQSLFDGWLRCDLSRNEERLISVLLPADFPRHSPRVYLRKGNRWETSRSRLPETQFIKEVA